MSDFESELQALVTKHGLSDVEITYKKKVTLSANKPFNAQIIAPNFQPIELASPEEGSSPVLDKYLGGHTGTVTT